MIYGIGNDLLLIARMEKTFERTGGRIVQRILGPNEIQVYEARRKRNQRRGLAYLCTRFAAKEAFSKAIGLGMHAPMTWRSVEVLNDSTGRPYLIYHGPLAIMMQEKNLHGQVTLTDEENMVSAVVIVTSSSINV
ncbi:holo-ACP synthase [Polynucleobacter kasalickyi]|uniref:Holo-[acyl-carrier-protein] synthase n=1 Tax=Polynucleobacter kasalickyi TaxID=1938817 RepID=A0A1W1YCW3_9BURK|nr:holo-ACP synthase [Polynucleobacter kasalickyi]SMC33954.1 holo-[acyl-carrier protein] synthase [Polynucleobacter kasalickyi]